MLPNFLANVLFKEIDLIFSLVKAKHGEMEVKDSLLRLQEQQSVREQSICSALQGFFLEITEY